MRIRLSFAVIAFSIITVSATTREGCNQNKIKTIVLRDQADVIDAHLDYNEGTPSTFDANTGEANELPIFSWTVYGFPVTGRALIRFSLKSIPKKSEILSAKLSLYGYPENFQSFAMPQGNKGDNIVVLQRVIDEWKENTVTWNNQPRVTREGEIALPISTSQWNYNVINFDVTSLIKDMRTTENYGFSLRLQTEQTYRSIGFLSSEYSDVTKRPSLEITYKK
ncbi:DNRLRE domain-containing protein [Ferruginibacter sp. SUN002]|uniref:DNRLRE domain-containing protein n=1 Tax=Ferruginibacter sp. SUN002 TaxID=2937789 RepID=UPI003D35C33F